MIEIRHKETGAVLHRAEFGDLPARDLAGAPVARAHPTAIGLEGADLAKTKLAGAALRGATLRGANLAGTDLNGADLSGADLAEARLWDADLRGANLRGAELWAADLEGADVRGADFTGARMFHTSSLGQVMGHTWLAHARHNYATRWPAGFRMEDHVRLETRGGHRRRPVRLRPLVLAGAITLALVIDLVVLLYYFGPRDSSLHALDQTWERLASEWGVPWWGILLVVGVGTLLFRRMDDQGRVVAVRVLGALAALFVMTAALLVVSIYAMQLQARRRPAVKTALSGRASPQAGRSRMVAVLSVARDRGRAAPGWSRFSAWLGIATGPLPDGRGSQRGWGSRPGRSRMVAVLSAVLYAQRPRYGGVGGGGMATSPR